MEISGVTGRVLTAETINAHNTFEKPETVCPAPFEAGDRDGDTVSVRIPCKSVVVLEFT
jgi:alpha-N-arabinofuranosidase